MILCTTSQYEKARAAHPDEPILCTDLQSLYLPGLEQPTVIGFWRQMRAIESSDAVPFIES